MADNNQQHGPVKTLFDLIVTTGGAPFANQEEGIRQFKAACLKAAEPVKAPSDEDLFTIHDEFFPTMMLGHDNYIRFARALLTRFGQPAESIHLQDLKNALKDATHLRQQLTLMEEHSRGEVWRWQGDGTDDLASMGNRMGVLIYACDLRALLAQPAASAGPQFKGWYCAHCQRGVDASEVTYNEQHQACGRVITDDRPPAPAAAQQDVAAATTIEYRAHQLVWDAAQAGMLVRIDLVPRKPLAMGNVQMVVDVRPARSQEAHHV